MKLYIILFINLLVCYSSYTQTYMNCKAVLLSKIVYKEEHCGVMMFVDKAKFKILDSGKIINNKVAIFYIICPNEYERKFWQINDTFLLKYHNGISAIKSLGENRIDKKLKIAGVVFDAKKFQRDDNN
jgi:hypothetical protein